MIDPATLAVAGGTFVFCWGTKKMLVRWMNQAKDKQLARSENITNQILQLEQWHMLWSHPDNDTEFYVWDEEDGWVERSIERVVKDMIGWETYSYGVRLQADVKLGVQLADGQWGPEHLEKVLDYGVFLVKDVLVELEESWKQKAIEQQREAAKHRERQNQLQLKMNSEYEERKRLDKAWKDSGKCRFCAGPRHEFSRDYCSTCWYARSNDRPGKLSKHPDEYKTSIKRGSRGGIFTTMNQIRVGEFEYIPQRYALDSSPSSPLDSRVQRIMKLSEMIRQCEDGEMKRRLIERREKLRNV